MELEAGSPDLVARHHSGVICDTGQATHLWSFSFPTCSTGTKPHLSYLPMGSNNGKIQCWANLSYHPYPVHFCAYILHAV